MREFTKRQWKALLAAYPLYVTPELSPSEALTPQSTTAEASVTARTIASFLEDGVPKVRRAFADVLASNVEKPDADAVDEHARRPRHGKGRARSASPARQFSIPPPLTPPRASGEAHWRESVPRDVDALLVYLFRSLASDKDLDEYAHPPPHAAHPYGPHCLPLTVVEKQLLGLCSRERQRAETYFVAQQALEQQVRHIAQTLLQYVDGTSACSPFPGMGARANDTGATAVLFESPQAPLNTSVRASGLHDDNVYRSHLADVPLTAEGLAELRRMQDVLNSEAMPGARQPGSASGHAVVAARACAGCGLADGELFTCGQCGCVRHEACDGPHPPETSDGASPLPALCRACRRDLRVDSGSSSSSLRSSTSTDERVALNQEFGTDDDDSSHESSLSGFIVHTSSDDEEEEDEEATDHVNSRADSEDGNSASDEEDAASESTASSQRYAKRPDKRGLKRGDARPSSGPGKRQDVKTSKRRRSPSSGSGSGSDEEDTQRLARPSPRDRRGRTDSRGHQPPRRQRPTLQGDADEDLATLMGANVVGLTEATTRPQPGRPSKRRRSELIVDSSASSSVMSSLSGDSSS